MAPIVEAFVSLSMFETGEISRIGDEHNGRVAQREPSMVNFIAKTCMDRSRSARESACRRGMATTTIRKQLRSI